KIADFIRSDAEDESEPEPIPMPQLQRDDPQSGEVAEGDAPSNSARDCGDFNDHCASGYTFFRRDTQVRSTADQLDKTNEWIYMVYDATKPGTVTNSTSTYSSAGDG